MVAFSRREMRALSGLARALLPEGHGVPGADRARVVESLDRRAATWEPAVRTRVRWLVRAWDLSPVFSIHMRTFSRLPAESQLVWVERAYRSRFAAVRLQVGILKQLLFLQWASTAVVEEALGYDYRCAGDEVARGIRPSPVDPPTDAPDSGAEPHDYLRVGPAVTSGAVPLHLTTVREPRAPAAGALATRSWPDIGGAERASVVVVGSGAGGAAVAATLAEAGVDVLVLEEGRQVGLQDFEGPMFDRFQRFCRDNGMTQVWGRPPIPLPLGKVVGGTTVVNSGTCFRAPDRVLHRWRREFGVQGASSHEMSPYYEAVETALSVRPVPWDLLGPNGRAAHRGAVSLGYSGGPLLRNITDCHGCGQCAFGCPTNAKQAMHVSYLPRASAAGARIYSRCRVDRIVIRDGRAVGVQASLLDGADVARGRLDVGASHVVLCAGAVHTPALLQASRVPDPSGQTGRNLRIHPATGVAAFFDDDSTYWKGTLQSYYIDEFFDSHDIMLEATTTIPSIGAGSIPGMGAGAMRDLRDVRSLATLGFYVSDTSAGRVRRLPRGDVVATYRMNQVDARRLSVGIAAAAEILLAAGAARVLPGVPGIDAISAREDIEQLKSRGLRPGQVRLSAFHPMGTVRMGADPERCVVDPFGRHHCVQGLWVADASTFPTCVAVNPQMTIMAFAQRTAERIVAAAGKG